MKKSAVNRENINYNVYNALNMVNEDLGESYIEDGFNPFDADFELNESYVTDVLRNQKEAKESETPEFINEGTKSTKEAFEKSLNSSQESLNQLMELIGNPRIPETKKKKLRKLIEYLKMRIQMLNLQIKKIKEKKEQNTLQMYQDINALNWYYYQDFEQSYKDEHFSIMDHLDHLLDLTQNPEFEQSRELLEEAQRIIEENIRNNNNVNEVKQIKEEIKDFVQDVKAGESLIENAQELINDIKTITKENSSKTNYHSNISSHEIRHFSNKSKEREDDGLSR